MYGYHGQGWYTEIEYNSLRSDFWANWGISPKDPEYKKLRAALQEAYWTPLAADLSHLYQCLQDIQLDQGLSDADIDPELLNQLRNTP